MAKIITFSATKGGVGKTSLTYHFGWYLAKSNPQNKVLMIDLDSQSTLSHQYMMRRMSDEQIAHSYMSDIYHSDITAGDVEDTGVKPQRLENDDGLSLYGLNADISLDSLADLMVSKGKTNGATLFGYLVTNGYTKDFDYILIDTHPGMNAYVKEAMIASDFVFSPVECSDSGTDSIVTMTNSYHNLRKQKVSLDRKPLINAKLCWIANNVEFNTSESIEFINAIQHDEDFIACFHKRDAIKKTTYNSNYVIDQIDHKSQLTKSDKNAKREITENLHKMALVASDDKQDDKEAVTDGK